MRAAALRCCRLVLHPPSSGSHNRCAMGSVQTACTPGFGLMKRQTNEMGMCLTSTQHTSSRTWAPCYMRRPTSQPPARLFLSRRLLSCLSSNTRYSM